MTLLALLGLIATVGLLGYWVFMSPYSQLFGYYPWRAKTTDKVVALTFDDGPNEPFTSEILDILKKQDIKATFFQVGQCARRYPETSRRVYHEGHTIGNHSLSHNFSNYFRSRRFRHEIEQTQDILYSLIGKRPALYRSPWLWRQPFLLQSVRRLGLVPVSGIFCHPLEPLQLSSQKIASRALAKIKPGSIIIFHDGYNDKGASRLETVLATKLVITGLKQRGYTFVTVNELLELPAYQT